MSLRPSRSAGRWFRQLLMWAAIGFAVIVASGPLLVLLFFAALGFAGWLLLHAARLGKEQGWRKSVAAMERCSAASAALAWSAFQALARVVRQRLPNNRQAWKSTRTAVTYAGGHFLEAASWSLTQIGNLGVISAQAGYARGCFLGGQAWRLVRHNAYSIASSTLEILAGAAVGGLLGYVLGDSAEKFVAVGAVVGAFLGLLVAISRYRPSPESTVGPW